MALAFLFLALVGPTVAHAQLPPPPAGKKDPALVTFQNGQEITRYEFEYVYQKNNGGWPAVKSHTAAQHDEYLELYVNFRRKVMEAQRVGLDTTSAFRTEYDGYIKQLAKPYLVERNVLDDLIAEAQQRAQEKRQVWAILKTVPPGASSDAQAQALAEITAIRDSMVKRGEPFEAMARKHSDHPYAQPYGGYMSWVTVFDLPYELENAVYKTPLGNAVSEPVLVTEGAFPGYYIVNVPEAKPVDGNRQLAHIIIRYGDIYTAKTPDEAKQRAQEAYQKLQNGGDFRDVVMEYSDDPMTRQKGGDLGSQRLIPPMEDTKHRLKAGEISAPFESAFGWHIVMVTQLQPKPTADALRNELRATLPQKPRAKLAEQKFIERLKQEYKYQANASTQTALLDAVGENYISPQFVLESVPEALRSQVLFSYAGKNVTVGEYVKGILAKFRPIQGMDAVTALRKELNQAVGDALLAHEETQLAAKYPEFKMLSREYHDGILLFTLTEQRVWRRAVEDTTGLQKFYEANKTKFPAPNRVRVTEYSAADSAGLATIRTLIQQQPETANLDSLVRAQNIMVKTYPRTLNQGSGALADELYKGGKGYLSAVTAEGYRFYFLEVEEYLSAGVKTFPEAKAEAITLYQEELERNWLAELAKRYPIKKVDIKIKQQLFQY
jgi:peptidyl-prolyl cis-trans isomerase SurA